MQRDLLRRTVTVKDSELVFKKNPLVKTISSADLGNSDVNWRRMSVKNPVGGPATQHGQDLLRATELATGGTTSSSTVPSPTPHFGFTPVLQPPQKGGPPVKKWFVEYRLVRVAGDDDEKFVLSPRERLETSGRIIPGIGATHSSEDLLTGTIISGTTATAKILGGSSVADVEKPSSLSTDALLVEGVLEEIEEIETESTDAEEVKTKEEVETAEETETETEVKTEEGEDPETSGAANAEDNVENELKSEETEPTETNDSNESSLPLLSTISSDTETEIRSLDSEATVVSIVDESPSSSSSALSSISEQQSVESEERLSIPETSSSPPVMETILNQPAEGERKISRPPTRSPPSIPEVTKQISLPAMMSMTVAPVPVQNEGSRPLAVKKAGSTSLMAYQQFRNRQKKKEEPLVPLKDTGGTSSPTSKSPRHTRTGSISGGESSADDNITMGDSFILEDGDDPSSKSKKLSKKEAKDVKKAKKEKEKEEKKRRGTKKDLPPVQLSSSPPEHDTRSLEESSEIEDAESETSSEASTAPIPLIPVSTPTPSPTPTAATAVPTPIVAPPSPTPSHEERKKKDKEDKKKKKDGKKEQKKDKTKEKEDDKKKKREEEAKLKEAAANRKKLSLSEDENKNTPSSAQAQKAEAAKHRKEDLKKAGSARARWNWLSNKTKDKKDEPTQKPEKTSHSHSHRQRTHSTAVASVTLPLELDLDVILVKGDLTKERFHSLFEGAFNSITLTSEVSAQERGLNIICQLSLELRFHEDMLEKGILNYIPPILNSPIEKHQIMAASILTNFSSNEITHNEYRNVGLIQMIGPLFDPSKNSDFLERLLGFIINISNSDRNRQALVKSGIFKDLIPILSHPNEYVLLFCSRALRNLFFEQDSQLAFCEAGGLKALMESRLLQSEYGLQFEWSMLISMLAWYRPDIRSRLVDVGVLNPLRELLVISPRADQFEIILRTLCYFSIDADLAESLVNSGAVVPIIEFLLQKSTEYLLIELSINLLCNLSQRPYVIASLLAESGVIPPILQLLEGQHGRDAILIRVANLLGNLAVDDVARNALMKNAAMGLLQAQISTPNHKFKESISNAILNLRLCGKAAAAAFSGEEDAAEVAAKMEKNAKHRASVMKELIETEKKYVENLLVMVTVFLEPLTKSSKPIISAEDAKGIFSIVEVISNIHTKFLATIQRRVLVGESAGREASVGDIFLDLADSLVVYRDYINNYNNALATLESSLTKSSFRKFLEEEKSNLKMDTLSLSSLLITPIQRIPRYVLMLQDLVDHMSTSSEDYPALTTALRKIIEIADYLDQEKATAESISALYAVQENLIDIDFEIAVSGRTAIREGPLMEEAKKKSESAYVFLFNDLLLLTRQKGTKYQVRHIIQLCDLLLGDLEPDPKDSTKKFGFKLENFDNEYHIFAVSQEEKDGWVKDLEETMKKDEYRWSAEEEAAKENIVRVYLEDCPMFQKLGISNAFKALTITVNTSSSEMVKQIITKIASRSALAGQIMKECATYRIYETNKNGTKGRSFQNMERPARSLAIKPGLKMMFGTPETDKV